MAWVNYILKNNGSKWKSLTAGAMRLVVGNEGVERLGVILAVVQMVGSKPQPICNRDNLPWSPQRTELHCVPSSLILEASPQ